ncbi:hypothetical protein BC827DRAFT_1267925 [Russula dissimulans]|nr:hypothetical protein BC827DRAFT_1267925 [Russula dissimulans]
MFKLFSGGRSVPTWTNGSSHSLPQETLPGGPSPDSVLHSHDTKPITARHQASAEEAGASANSDHRHETSWTTGNADGSTNRGGPEVDAASGPSTIAPHRRRPNVLADAKPTVDSNDPSRSPSSPSRPPRRPQASEHPRVTTTADTSASHRDPDGQSPLSDAPRENSNNLRALSLGVSNLHASGGLVGAAELEGLPGGTENARRSASVASRTGRRTYHALGIDGVSIGGGAAAAATATNEPSNVAPAPASSLQARGDDGVGRKLSKIIKRDAKAEKAALHVALKELTEIQKLQKASIKEEAVSHSWHSRALSDAHKAEMGLLAARTESERRQGSLRAAGEVLEANRKHAFKTTEMLREKMEEVERLRICKQVDDRERAIKVKSLAGGRHGLSRILGSR